MNYSPKPPKFAVWLIRVLLSNKPYVEEAMSDLEEQFLQQYRLYGPFRAYVAYLGCLFGVLHSTMGSLLTLPGRLATQLSKWALMASVRAILRATKKDNSKEPPESPIVGRFLLKALVPREQRKEAYGDAIAEFPLNWKEFGKWGAYSLFWRQVGAECFPTLWRWFRWFFWGFLIPHLSEIWHKFVG